ncbi:hypothetical protein ACLV0K_002173, partial [Neisseria gonorrhoeae]
LRLLQQTACRFKAALETAAWKHYVRAIKESEPVPDAEARPEAEKTGGVNIIKFGGFKWIANT